MIINIIMMARAIRYLLVSIYSKQTQKLALKSIFALSFEVRNIVANFDQNRCIASPKLKQSFNLG